MRLMESIEAYFGRQAAAGASEALVTGRGNKDYGPWQQSEGIKSEPCKTRHRINTIECE